MLLNPDLCNAFVSITLACSSANSGYEEMFIQADFLNREVFLLFPLFVFQ